MNGRGDASEYLLRRIGHAAFVIGPLLIGVALVLYFSSRGTETTPAAAAPVVRAAVQPSSSPVKARTGRPTKQALASTSRSGVAEPNPADKKPAAAPADATSPIVWVRGGRSIRIYDAPRGNVIATQRDATEFGSPSVFAVERQTKRWFGISTPLVANGSLGWIRDDTRTLRGGYIDYSIDVDLSTLTASLSRDGSEIRSWPISIGAPASPTPTGTFAVTDTFRGGLNPAYGCCALAISATQSNLPSTWLGGNRIAIHGTNSPLGTAVSNGCIHSADAEVAALVATVPLGTPVTIHE